MRLIDRMHKIFLVIFSMMLIVTISFIQVQSHEDAHATIYKYFGCRDVQENVTFFSGATQCLNFSEINHDMLPYVFMAEANVDAIGYQLEPQFLIIEGLLLTILLVSLESKEEIPEKPKEDLNTIKTK